VECGHDFGEKMKLSLLVHTVHFCGDHAQDACIALEPIDGETIEQLVERAKLGQNSWAGDGEYIAIRLVHRTLD